MNIYGKRVIIRAIEKEDLEELRASINDRETEKLVLGWSFPVSAYQQERWYESIISDKNNFRWIIDTKEYGAIGIITLKSIDWKNRNASNGIRIGKKDLRGQGYGKDSIMAIMRYAFEELQLERLYNRILETNITSMKLYESCGWKKEGVKRRHIFKDNRYHNQYFLGILREEYLKLIEKTKYWDK